MKTELKPYKGGFTVNGKHPIETDEWLLSEEDSTENKLVFLGYDANLCPTPDFSKWPKTDWKEKVIHRCLEFTKDFRGEVWLDDVRVK